MGGDKQSMSVCKQYTCANANDRLVNQDLTPRWLNLISGALALISIKITLRGG